MDTFTHIALGAIIGEVAVGKAFGKKAMMIGALAQCLPDVDFVMSFWLRPVDNLLAHRGFTHSLLFCIASAALLGLLMAQWHRSAGISKTKWILFFGLQISIHLLLDTFNSYGVGWFEPFSHLRVAFDIVYVADPFYSIWLGVACLALLLLKNNSSARRNWTRVSLALSTIYLLYAIYNKGMINNNVKLALHKSAIPYSRLLTTPTPLNNWLWYIIAETDSGYHVGYRSVFDSVDSINFTFFPQQASLLNSLDDKEDLQKLKRFSKGYFTIERRDDALLFNDLRFGQIAGWSDPRAMFAFHYDLLHPDANLFVVQQGRFLNWNRKTVRVLIRRIGATQRAGR